MIRRLLINLIVDSHLRPTEFGEWDLLVCSSQGNTAAENNTFMDVAEGVWCGVDCGKGHRCRCLLLLVVVVS